jgi:hypothetical protein
MAYLESAVVVYLRIQYYPGGFHFPLVDIPIPILLIEIGREVATIIMIWSVAKLISKSRQECFAFFIYIFAIWDICYYLWLKLFIDWPGSLLEWDVLFLIPVPWIGPVLAPVIVSLSFILTAYLILKYEYKNKRIPLTKKDWMLEIGAGLIIVFTFFWETGTSISKGIPQYYPWWLFIATMILGLFVFFRRLHKIR